MADESQSCLNPDPSGSASSQEKVNEVISDLGKTSLNVSQDEAVDADGRGDNDNSDDDGSDTSEHNSQSNLDSDTIDEEQLKDAEVLCTEEEKEARKDEALQYKSKGNDLFKAGNFVESAESYTLALRTCPLKYSKERAILYANRAAAKMKLERYETALEDCTKAVELDQGYIKAWVRKAQIDEKLEKLDEALEDYKKVLLLDPCHKEAGEAVRRLPDQIAERNEKLKEEMLGKLKDLGNMILRPFGLSTNNFQMTKDPNSGGYSVNFKNNPN
ncbi:tetratricopeptide repeat protein 1 [Ischnura elegans]|uniref:tetratricopeptide repeat protein 1 n=1 Tax=Ischnura elegans TaxID=197161 RepID=UPI001ED86CFB|nr:tetratricopeptide repeat protein 1 [Ischnura elegans]XP_046383765.1 tetratricopeptide repeat protein 1 [Ischnura elegans]